MLNKKWKTLDGKVVDVIPLFTELMSQGKRIVQIGSDSQQDCNHTEFVTVIVILVPGKGGRAIYMNERTSRIKSLRERLMREVWMSVSVGMELQQYIPDDSEFSIHIDANPNVKFKSSSYIKELTGMVVGQGFKAVLKPDSWCASHAADHIVKYKVLKL